MRAGEDARAPGRPERIHKLSISADYFIISATVLLMASAQIW